MASKFDSQSLELAEQLCEHKGVRFTKQRKWVFQLVSQSDKALGAYEILELMRKENPRVAPPTVYRALEFLVEQGLVHKLETLHAYVGCHHPAHPHHGQFLICEACGLVTELEVNGIDKSLDKAAAETGFRPNHGTIEVTGLCASCSGE